MTNKGGESDESHVRQQGLTPFDHQAPGVALDAPVQRPWGDREFELEDPDGQIWAFTEVEVSEVEGSKTSRT